MNKYGQVQSSGGRNWDAQLNLEKVYNESIPVALNLPLAHEHMKEFAHDLLRFAEEQRIAYEGQVAAIMNKFHLQHEGELFTGCLRKFHKFDKKRQNEVAEDVRRQCHTICAEYRAEFFRTVHDFATALTDGLGPNNDAGPLDLEKESKYESNFDVESDDEGEDEDDEDDELLKWVEAIATRADIPAPREGDVSFEARIRRVAHMLAGAYYFVTYSPWRKKSEMILFSFPWVVSDVIAAGLSISDLKPH